MTWPRRLSYPLLVPVLSGLARLWWGSCRFEIIGEGGEEARLSVDEPIIPCLWHQQFLACTHVLALLLRRGCRIGWLISPSKDGELAARIARRRGVSVVRGSSTRVGWRAMRRLYRGIQNEGISPVTLPDGPQGPARRFKVGTLVLSQLSGAPILPIACVAAKAWFLPSWDRTLLPRPFTRIVIAVGELQRVPKALTGAHLERERLAMEARLNGLEEQARAHLLRRTGHAAGARG